MREFESIRVLRTTAGNELAAIRIGRLLTQNTELPRPRSGSAAAAWILQKICQKGGVDYVNISGLRTGPYIGRTGSDSVCFLEFPVFTRAGMQFESHLGHSMTPRQRGLLL
jgi:hypothetical protein